MVAPIMTRQDAIVDQHHQLASELYRLIQTMDPATFKAEFSSRVEEMVAALRSRVHEMMESRRLPDSFQAHLKSLKEATEQWDPRIREAKAEWKQRFKRLQDAYEELAKTLRARQIEVPVLRQTNYKRSLFHAMNGIIGVLAIQHIFSSTGIIIFATTFTAVALTMEIGRRFSEAWNDRLMAMFKSIAHPHEAHRMNSATWYLLALTVLAWGMEPMVQSIAVIVLGLADPAAGTIGRRWGKRKLVGNKSWAGTGTFVAVAGLSTLAVLAIYYPTVGMSHMLLLAAVAALSGAVAELFTGKIDDNFTIPVSVGLALMLVLAL